MDVNSGMAVRDLRVVVGEISAYYGEEMSFKGFQKSVIPGKPMKRWWGIAQSLTKDQAPQTFKAKYELGGEY